MNQTEVSKPGVQSMVMFRMEDDSLLAFPNSKSQKNILGNFKVAKSKEHGGAYHIPSATYKRVKAGLSEKNLDAVEVKLKDDLTVEEFKELKPAEKLAQTEYCFRRYSEYSKMAGNCFYRGCIFLAEINESLDYGTARSFYQDTLRVSDRTAQRWIEIGRVLRDFKCDNVGAFDPQHLYVIIKLKEAVREAIFQHKIKSTVQGFLELKRRQDEVIGDETDLDIIKSKIEALFGEIKEKPKSRLDATVFLHEPESQSPRESNLIGQGEVRAADNDAEEENDHEEDNDESAEPTPISEPNPNPNEGPTPNTSGPFISDNEQWKVSLNKLEKHFDRFLDQTYPATTDASPDSGLIIDRKKTVAATLKDLNRKLADRHMQFSEERK